MHTVKRTAAELAVVQELADAALSASSSSSRDRLNPEILKGTTHVKHKVNKYYLEIIQNTKETILLFPFQSEEGYSETCFFGTKS